MRKVDLHDSANNLSMADTANSLNTSLSPDMHPTGSPLLTGRYDPNQPASKPSNWHLSDSVDNLKKYSYARELQEQIAQRQEKKYNDLHTERQTDIRLLQERRVYDPFGKQGSGAPLRDGNGEIITAKNKALSTLHDFPQRSLFAGASPAFSLKARLARENLLTRSTHNLQAPLSTTGRRALSNVDMPSEEPATTTRTGMELSIPPKTPMLHNTLQQSAFAPNASSSLFSSTVQSPNPMQFVLPTPIFMFPPPSYAMPPSQMSMSAHPGLTGRSHREDFSHPVFEDTPLLEPPSSRFMRSTEREPEFTGNWYIDEKIAAKQEKSKRIQKYAALQDDLLRQIDEKKRMKEAGDMQKKYDDILDEARMKKDNDEIRFRDQMEAEKRKLAFDNNQQEYHKLGPSAEYVKKIKGKARRVRTPLEEVEERIRLEKLELEKSKQAVLIQDKSAAAKEAEKKDGKKAEPVSEEVLMIKDSLGYQQKLLQDQLTEVKQKLMEINRERILNGYQVEELKNKLKQQQVMDEVRRAELFHNMMESQKYPSILPTITHLTLDKDEEYNNNPFAFPLTTPDVRNLRDAKVSLRAGDSLDAMIAVQTHSLPLDYRFVPTNVKPTDRISLKPVIDESQDDDKHSGLKYLSYFNPMEHHTGIKMDDNTNRFDMLDGYEKAIKFDLGKSNDTVGETVNQILRKNKDRLAVLEGLETKENIEYTQGFNNFKGAMDNDLAL